jgi:hypothetical protein
LSSVAPLQLCPLDQTGHHLAPVEILPDLVRSKSELVAENAFLRKPLIVLRRQVIQPACTKTDRMILVLLAKAVRTQKQGLFIVMEDDLNPLVLSENVSRALLPL